MSMKIQVEENQTSSTGSGKGQGAGETPVAVACETPWEDLRAGALREYDEVSSRCHSWASVIPQAINFYFDNFPRRPTANSMPDQKFALSGQCDNDFHSGCPYPVRCRCACHRPEGLTAVGDERCVRCSHINAVSWFVASPLWNEVVRANGHPEMLCPTCFMELALEAGINPTAWQLAPETIPDANTVAAIDAAKEIVASALNEPERDADTQQLG